MEGFFLIFLSDVKDCTFSYYENLNFGSCAVSDKMFLVTIISKNLWTLKTASCSTAKYSHIVLSGITTVRTLREHNLYVPPFDR